MSQIIQAVRGMNDILPDEMVIWNKLESVLGEIIQSYGYLQVRLPILEKTELFARSIGDVTDIVEKEMYTFQDRNGESLTLRPEGTAGCVRAGIEHGLLYNQTQRLWYCGPMFRHERPQKGRYRQFYQLGVEAFGMVGPDIDLELLLMTSRFWKALGISDQVVLQINSLGNLTAREVYRKKLIEYFKANYDGLDEDSKRRLETNPLRILDSKNPDLKTIIQAAPVLLDYLDEDSSTHFDKLCKQLDNAKIPYQVNPRLVRGLDYYNKTVFEWVTDALGAQGTVCAGGRYDGLVELLNGNSTPAVGFAMGLERLVALLNDSGRFPAKESNADIYMILVGEEASNQGLLLAEELRAVFPQFRIISHCGGGSFKSQFKKADKSGAKIALILGDDEIANRQIAIKYLREDRPQDVVQLDELFNYLHV